jgi:hypothetical protein
MILRLLRPASQRGVAVAGGRDSGWPSGVRWVSNEGGDSSNPLDQDAERRRRALQRFGVPESRPQRPQWKPVEPKPGQAAAAPGHPAEKKEGEPDFDEIWADYIW